MVATLFLIAGSGLSVFAQAPATGQDAGAAKGPKYTQAEYNAEQAVRRRSFRNGHQVRG